MRPVKWRKSGSPAAFLWLFDALGVPRSRISTSSEEDHFRRFGCLYTRDTRALISATPKLKQAERTKSLDYLSIPSSQIDNRSEAIGS
jgi:hypothetical protein